MDNLAFLLASLHPVAFLLGEDSLATGCLDPFFLGSCAGPAGVAPPPGIDLGVSSAVPCVEATRRVPRAQLVAPAHGTRGHTLRKTPS